MDLKNKKMQSKIDAIFELLSESAAQELTGLITTKGPNGDWLVSAPKISRLLEEHFSPELAPSATAVLRWRNSQKH